MIEDRLARLEETLFFQDRLLNDLNSALTGQQKQLDALERGLQELREQVEDLRMVIETGGTPANAPPPHYQER